MILDASIVMKWLLDEGGSDAAELLLGRIDLTAPAFLRVEVGYALTKRARQRLIPPDEVRGGWQDLANVALRYVDDQPLVGPALELSLGLGASFYDCIYLALAQKESDVVVTADERFVRAVRARPGLAGYVQTLAEAAA